jgi:hypothetical protein
MENLERHLRRVPYLSLGDSVRRRLGNYTAAKRVAEQRRSSRGDDR